MTVSVDCGNVVHTMQGGIGASWHAIETPIPYGVNHPVFTSYSQGGSGWGGYPPADDRRAWEQIERHAAWLGLNWNRVEVEQRIYEPQRGEFTWDSPEMLILYRILDWNQRHGADVFFQQMWCNAAWLAYPEFRTGAVERVHSAPADLAAFADGLAGLMEHLIKQRGYTCIKWLSITNEPGEKWSWWQAPPDKPLKIDAGLAAVRHALDRRGLKLPLSGPDHHLMPPAQAAQRYGGLDLLGAYDFHDYGVDFDFRAKRHIAAQEQALAPWIALARREGKPVFFSEFGTMAYGWVPDKPGPNSPPAALAAAEFMLRLANAGVDGFNRWSFLNRGDLDGQWQFVDTWDPRRKQLLRDFRPHPNSYFGLGLLSRFTVKHSAVLAARVDGGRLDGFARVFAAAFRSPPRLPSPAGKGTGDEGGNLTLAMVNDATSAFPLKVALAAIPKPTVLWRYRYGDSEFNRADVKVDPQAGFRLVPGAAELRDSLPPRSLTLYSAYKLSHDMPAPIEEP